MAGGKLHKSTKYTILLELRTNQTRGVLVPKPLSRAKIARNLEQLKAHYAATEGARGVETLKTVVTTLDPTVQHVCQDLLAGMPLRCCTCCGQAKR